MATNLLTDPIKLRFYVERYEKENRSVTVRELFVPNVRTKSLTGKFYARHDPISKSDVREDDIDLIKRRIELTPKDVYAFRPPAINMEYGWFAGPLIPVAKDPRLRFPKIQSDFIAFEIRRRKSLGGLKEKKFAGVPFKT